MSNPADSASEIVADASFAQSMGRIERLVGELEGVDSPLARNLARDLTQAILDLHGQGLRRIVAALAAADVASPATSLSCLDDPLVSSLLVLHGIHPTDLGGRIAQALERARVRLAPQNAGVTLVASDSDSVRLRLEVSGGCPSASDSLRRIVEDALAETAADVVAVSWEEPPRGPGSTAGFVSLESLSGR